jgi:hypothetical protein
MGNRKTLESRARQSLWIAPEREGNFTSIWRVLLLVDMSEIQNCLPVHSRQYFIRVRNSKWEGARAVYNEKLLAIRQDAAAKNVLRSGHQELAEWNLSQEFIGNLSKGYFDAAIETCTLYNIRLDEHLCDCIQSAIKEFLITQRKNALQHAAQGLPGAIKVPLSIRQQLSGDHNLPHFNDILIELEKARIKSIRIAAQKESLVNQTLNVHGPNARVNIGSTDNSTNVVNQGIPFSELRKAIEANVADGVERTAILERLADLETATNRESGTKKYQEFISTAANHMALIGPYLPALGHWVHSLLG